MCARRNAGGERKKCSNAPPFPTKNERSRKIPFSIYFANTRPFSSFFFFFFSFLPLLCPTNRTLFDLRKSKNHNGGRNIKEKGGIESTIDDTSGGTLARLPFRNLKYTALAKFRGSQSTFVPIDSP